jgi:hypothetical protein
MRHELLVRKSTQLRERETAGLNDQLVSRFHGRPSIDIEDSGDFRTPIGVMRRREKYHNCPDKYAFLRGFSLVYPWYISRRMAAYFQMQTQDRNWRSGAFLSEGI